MAIAGNILPCLRLSGVFRAMSSLNIRNAFGILSIRHYKHYNPKFKWHRKMKFIQIDLPDYHNPDWSEGMTKDEIRSKMKEQGISPPRYWKEKPYLITNTSGPFERYIPPEGDGKVSFYTKTGAKQNLEFVGKKGKSTLAIRKIKRYYENFTMDHFLQEAQEIYIKAHEALMKDEMEELLPYATEHAISDMYENKKNRTIRWKFIKSLEPPKVVLARVKDVITKTNEFAQITVRFHTQQQLAVYDRFGRLFYGSEILAKDVLEYIVFEQHLSNNYGKWKLHSKIIPDWLPPSEPSSKTVRLEPEQEEEEEPEPQSPDKVERVQQAELVTSTHQTVTA